jgi:uncharacterized membrane protein
MSPKDFFSPEQQSQLIQAIRAAEKNTSGEVRVHLDKTCSGDPYKRAIQVFEKLNMHKTAQRNGVLFYLSIEDHKLAIIGDRGINEKVPNGFWDRTFSHMIQSFKEGNILEGLTQGLAKAGEQLSTYFPYQKNDQNELSDELSF